MGKVKWKCLKFEVFKFYFGFYFLWKQIFGNKFFSQKIKKGRKPNHLEMKIEHFCCSEAWERQVFNFTFLFRMAKGGKQFSIKLYCAVFQGEDDLFSPSRPFSLPPWALFLREEYLHECVSVVPLFLFCFEATLCLCCELSYTVSDFRKQSTAWGYSGSLKLRIVEVCVTSWLILFSVKEN